MGVEPDEVADPVGVGVAGDDDVVLVESGKGPVSVALVAVPGVVVEGVDVSACGGFVNARED